MAADSGQQFQQQGQQQNHQQVQQQNQHNSQGQQRGQRGHDNRGGQRSNENRQNQGQQFPQGQGQQHGQPAPHGHPNRPQHAHRASGRPAFGLNDAIPPWKQLPELAHVGSLAEKRAIIKPFEELTSIDPQPRYTLEYPGCPDSCRLIDMFCPVGRGQRALIVSPPKAGKTTLLQDIARAITHNYPDVQVIGLLIDERPEEVTDFRRKFHGFGLRDDGTQRAQVVGSSNDHGVERHVAVALGTISLAKRLMESGEHVVIVMDSLTRLGRAFNLSKQHASSGRTLSGGLDARALEVPKQIFGSARNTEEAGSLTIIASCLIDTGSAGDQVIFEEFKGTGNMELVLDRKIAERRLFPAINLAASGTRKEDLLMSEQEYKTITALRRRLISMPPHVQIEQLLGALKRFKTNLELVGSAGGQ